MIDEAAVLAEAEWAGKKSCRNRDKMLRCCLCYAVPGEVEVHWHMRRLSYLSFRSGIHASL
jgi:hypothetical protein